jgi:hypothetical protein
MRNLHLCSFKVLLPNRCRSESGNGKSEGIICKKWPTAPQKMADRPHATSTAQAVLPAVARNRDDLENPKKAAVDVDDRYPPPPGAGVNKWRRGSAQVDPPLRKRAKSRPCYPYTEQEDGKPPEMLLLHVHFARFCVDLLHENPDLTQHALITRFNASELSRGDASRAFPIAIHLKRNDGSVGSPPIEGTRLAYQSRKHPFAQLDSLSLNIYFNSLAAEHRDAAMT